MESEAAAQAQLLPSLRALHTACAEKRRTLRTHLSELERVVALLQGSQQVVPVAGGPSLTDTDRLWFSSQMQGLKHEELLSMGQATQVLATNTKAVADSVEQWQELCRPHREAPWFPAWLEQSNAALQRELDPAAVKAE